MTGLDALKEINKVIPYAHITNEYKIIEKELKALEIILTKDIDVGAFKKLVFGRIPLTDKEKLDYWNDVHNNKITKEEYELLKEVLL